MTAKEKQEIAKLTAQYIHEIMDEVWPLDRVAEHTGLSKSYVYHHAREMGGVKRCGKWFFSRNNINAYILQGQ